MSHEHDHAGGHAGHAEIEINIKGMDCGDCSAKIITAVNGLSGFDFHDVQCSHETGKLTLCCGGDKDAMLEAVKGAVEACGFHYEGCGHGDEHGHGHGHGH